jgi:hypothetical protein
VHRKPQLAAEDVKVPGNKRAIHSQKATTVLNTCAFPRELLARSSDFHFSKNIRHIVA